MGKRFWWSFLLTGGPFGVLAGSVCGGGFLLLEQATGTHLTHIISVESYVLLVAGVGGGSGLVFGCMMGAASLWLRDWVRADTEPILADNEQVQQQDTASLEGNGGMLYLTDRCLRFTPHSMNAGGEDWSASFSEIEDAQPARSLRGLVPNAIRLRMESGREKTIIVWEREEWCTLINQRVSDKSRGATE